MASNGLRFWGLDLGVGLGLQGSSQWIPFEKTDGAQWVRFWGFNFGADLRLGLGLGLGLKRSSQWIPFNKTLAIPQRRGAMGSWFRVRV